MQTFEGPYYGKLTWSPDRTKILIGKDEAPCIIDVDSLEIKCLDINQPKEGSFYTDLFHWSQDSQQIYYGQSADRADLCIYDLITDKIFCPTSTLEVLEDRLLNIEVYRISPDEQFFVFSYGFGCANCNYWGEPSSAIIRRDGTDFYFLGEENLEPFYPYGGLLIRP